MKKLDMKDRRILYELDKNARQPLSRIARAVNLKRESVLYRLNKYLSSGLIRDFLTVIDMSKLGYHYAKVYVRLSQNNVQEELMTRLSADTRISWVAACDGPYSVIYGPKYRTLKELADIVQDYSNAFHHTIRHQDISNIIEARHFHRDYLVGASAGTERSITWGSSAASEELDAIDQNILDKLCRQPRSTAVDIASSLGVSSDLVIKHIKALQRKGIIQHYMIWPDVNKLCGEYYKVLVSFSSITSEQLAALVTYSLQHPNVVYYTRTLGLWQVELDIEARNPAELRSILHDYSNTFPFFDELITLNIYDERKFRFFELDDSG